MLDSVTFHGREVTSGYDWRTLDLTSINYNVPGVSEQDIREQLRLEEKALMDGAAAFRRRMEKAVQRGDAGAVGGYRKVIEALLLPTAEALRVVMDEQYAKRAQRRLTVWRMLPPGLDAEQLAYITIKVAIGTMIKGATKLQRIAEEIGRAVELEATVIKFLNESGEKEAAFVKRLKSTTSSMRHIRGAILSVMAKRDIEPIGWTNHECVLVGTNLLEVAREATGFVERELVPRRSWGKYTTDTSVTLRPEIQEWALDQNFKDEFTRPERTPMVIPPRPWTSLRGGGYLGEGNLRKRMLMIPRDKEHADLLKQSFKTHQVAGVLEAVNRVQSTAWKINTDILDIIQRFYDDGIEWGGLVSSADPEFPPKPEDIETSKESRDEWKRKTAAVWQERAKRVAKRFEVVTKLRIASDYRDYPSIYFPHEMDFRGRLYPSSVGLQPQGDDISKSLLKFAKGLPITDPTSLRWFRIHGANVYGKDKDDFDTREAWAITNHDMINRCATNPFDNRDWLEADNPFQFLAWAQEHLRYTQDPANFLSHIPVALDGTCNGIQHFAAMLRDEVAGSSVNLTPSSKPQDIYGAVAVRAMQMMIEEDNDDDLVDGILAFGIDRGMAKPAVMILPYGGKTLTFYDRILSKIRETVAKNDKDRVWPWVIDDGRTRAAQLLMARYIVKAMRDTVSSGTLVLAWIQSVVRAAADHVVPNWTTPDGLVISSAYKDDVDIQIETNFQGRVRVWVSNKSSPDAAMNKQRMITATPPNFVHSLDACALRMTVNALPPNTSLAMIHDSYGTHAADTEALALTLRQAFVNMYENHDPLRDLYEETQRRIGDLEQLPEPPARGTLDLKQVLNSEYFFA